MGTVKVQGKGRVSAEPDIVTLAFDIEAHHMQYGKSITHLNKRVNELRKNLAECGRDAVELKTSSFNVHVHTRYENKVSVFDGYMASHRLHIELPLKKELLNQVLHSVAKGLSGAEFRLNFSVKDQVGLRRMALANAVQEARANAEALAKAAGVKLGKLQQIEYGWGEVHFYDHSMPVYSESADTMPTQLADIEPDEVEASDNVTLVFEIEE